MFAVFILCLLENVVCSEIEEEKYTVEHGRVLQCDRTQTHTEEIQRKQRVPK